MPTSPNEKELAKPVISGSQDDVVDVYDEKNGKYKKAEVSYPSGKPTSSKFDPNPFGSTKG